MATFLYKAHSASGEVRSGQAEADDRKELVARLRQQGLFCYHIEEEKNYKNETRRLKLKELTDFCRQLASMLTAGINVSRALDTIYQSNTNKKIRAAAMALHESVLRGQSLSQSMKQLGNTFPELVIYMTEAGEASGSLESILEDMADHYEQELQLKKKAQSALIYPCILCAVAFAVVIFMLTSVLPKFISMYDGVELPAPTRLLLSISNMITENWPILLGITLGAALLISWAMTQKRFRIAVKKAELKLPVVGKIMRTILTARFASTFAILYSSGIGILQSTDIISRVVNNDYLEEKLQLVKARLQDGQMFSATLEQIDVFDRVLITMMSVGEESGTLDSMLKKTGRNFQRDAENAMVRLVSLIEPVMIVGLGGLIGFIVLAIITPTFEMFKLII